MLIAGNWKMNLKYEDILKFKDILTDLKLDNRVEMAIFLNFLCYILQKNIYQIIILR